MDETTKGELIGVDEAVNEVEVQELVGVEATIRDFEKELGVTVDFEEHIDREEGEERYSLRVTSKEADTIIKCSLLDDDKVSAKLLTEGHNVDGRTLAELIRLKAQAIKAYTNFQFHKRIGWGKYKGEDVFKYRDVITKTNVLSSEYRGKLEIACRGDLNTYVQGMRSLVVPYPKLMIVYIAGLAGIVNQLLGEVDTNIFLNIAGESSIGKSTAEHLALSAWGNDKILTNTFNNTINRSEELLTNLFIQPCVLDDIMCQEVDSNNNKKRKFINEQIFRFATGLSKGRLEEDSKQYFSSVITSTELPMIEILIEGRSEGQLYRLIELNVKKGDFTQDAKHAEQIERLIKRNYGLVANELGKFMIKNGCAKEQLEDMFDEKKDMLMVDKRLAGHARVANRLAILMITGNLLNQCFNFGIDLEQIKEILVESVLSPFTSIAKNKTAHDKLRKTILENPDKFAKTKDIYDDTCHVGVYRRNVYGNQELIIKTERLGPMIAGVDLASILQNKATLEERREQYRDSELMSLLRNWRDSGLIDCCNASDRFTKKLTFGSEEEQSKSYTIIFKKDENKGGGGN